MKLIPKAKPVKIRIKSGGEEHSSLDSLLHNFDISDIKPLLDGRLVRWLKQQGENELANIINEFDASGLNTTQGVMDLMKIFFADYMEGHPIPDLLGLIKHWLKSSVYRKNAENLFYYTAQYLCDDKASLDITKYLYKQKEELECPRINWYMVFNSRISQEDEAKNDPEVLFIVGKMLWEGYQFNDLYVTEHHIEDSNGLELIEKSARLGCQEANLFIFEYNRRQKERTQRTESQTKATHDTKRFDGVDKDKIRNWWYNGERWDIVTFGKLKDECPNNKEKIILEFLFLTDRLDSIAERFGFKQALQTACSSFAEIKDTDILRNEKKFLIGLLYLWCNDRSKSNSIFKQIQDYKLAKLMLSNLRVIDHLDFKSMSFRNQLSFIIDHLFDYE